MTVMDPHGTTPPQPPAAPPVPTPQPPPAPAPEPAAPPATPGDDGTDWKAMARQWEDRAKRNSDAVTRLQEIEDAKKTEQERLADELAAAKAEGATSTAGLLRLDVALDKAPAGMEPAKIRKLAERLRGSTREELEADAAELFADFTAAAAPDDPAPAPGQPTPRPDPAQGSRGDPPAPRPTSMGAAIGAALKPKT